LTTYALDPSVAAKWFLPPVEEPLSAEAMALLREYTQARVDFIVPDLFFPEFGNIFWKAERRGRVNRKATESALREMVGRQLRTYPMAPLIEPAMRLARAYGRTVYDCVYVALAIETSAQMVTADEKLVNSVAGSPVIWLGLV
jgi:predicted nucleic acid-binding protein